MTREEVQAEVLATLGELTHDPLGFVRWAFPWGEPGTGLENETGPDEWQAKQQGDIGRSLAGDPFRPIQDATASGHGIGKSAEVAWLTFWALMTFEDTRGVVTANTEGQLRTKTWAELSKWYHLLIPPLRDLFVLEATSIHARDKAHTRTWRIDAIPWSASNPAAFAGLHNAGKRVFLCFDEASEIADIIWETAEGATTDADTEVVWVAYGNPTQNTGRFKEVVEGKFRKFWSSRKIDSRSVKRTNKATIEKLVTAYGEDSDFVRMRVLGQFPRVSSTQFIAEDVVLEAMDREPGYIATDPLIFGLDVARFGDDASVLAIRRGRDAYSIPWKSWRKLDTMAIAAYVFELAELLNPDAIFVDVSGGLGAGVADRLRQMNCPCPVIDVNFGSAGGDVMLTNGTTMRAANMRAAMHMKMRDWLELGAIPNDDELKTDLTQVQYGFRGAENAIQLESKDDMKARGLSSPDKGDALGLTFAYPVAPRVVAGYPSGRSKASVEYDIFAAIR